MKINDLTNIISLKYHSLMSYKEGAREPSVAGLTFPPSPSDRFLRTFSSTTLSYLSDDYWEKIVSARLRDVSIDTHKENLAIQLFDRTFSTIMIRLLRDYSAASCFNRMFHPNRHHQTRVRNFLTDNNYLDREGKITTREDLTIETLTAQLDTLMTSLQTSAQRVNPDGTLKELADFAKFLNAIQIEIKGKIDVTPREISAISFTLM